MSTDNDFLRRIAKASEEIAANTTGGTGGTGTPTTASNVNLQGIGVFKQKTGSNLEFKGIYSASAAIAFTDDAANNSINLALDASALKTLLALTPGDVGADPAGSAASAANFAANAIAAHEVDTTFIHGIADTSALVLTGDSRLSDARAPLSHTQSASTISDSTAVGRSLLTAMDVPAQRTALGLGTLATQNGTFSGTSSGTNTGDQTSITGNAGTATKLATPRQINGVAFDGSADISITASDGWTYLTKVTDQTFASSTALVVDNIFVIPTLALSSYLVEAAIAFTGTAATGGLKSGFTTPPATLEASGTWECVNTTTVVAAPLITTTPSLVTAALMPARGRADGKFYVFNGATAGNLNFAWAQVTLAATGVTVKAGSYVRYKKL